MGKECKTTCRKLTPEEEYRIPLRFRRAPSQFPWHLCPSRFSSGISMTDVRYRQARNISRSRHVHTP